MDPELEALNKINEAIKDLQEDQKVRVVVWLINKYSIHPGQPINTPPTPKGLAAVSNPDEAEVIEGETQSLISFSSAAELLAKCSPKTDSEKVLVVASYLQAKNGDKDLTGYEINHTLKNIGHGVSSIPTFIASLMEKKPQLMIQTRKSGNSKQARKNYRVTDEGMKEVERLLKK
jgi:hypothetical protein